MTLKKEMDTMVNSSAIILRLACDPAALHYPGVGEERAFERLLSQGILETPVGTPEGAYRLSDRGLNVSVHMRTVGR